MRVERDVVYGQPLGFRELSLDLWLPDADAAPLIVFVHGGGFRAGSRRVFVPTMRDSNPFERMTDAGFAVASVDYRLSGEAVFPAQLDDLAAALAWLREHAVEFGVDANRIVLWGESAGATIAALAALADPGVAGVVDWYGPADLAALPDAADPTTREAGWLGGSAVSLPEQARAASPVHAVHAGAPPFLIAHGAADEAVPPSQSEALAAALRDSGVEVELELVPGAGHLWQGDVDRIALLDRALTFARRVTAA